jgi:hypothetical protein
MGGNIARNVLRGNTMDYIYGVDVALWELGLLVPRAMTVVGVRGQFIAISGEG